MAETKLVKQYVTKNLSGSVTVAKDDVGVVTGDITLSNYTPIGIVRVQKSGAGASSCSITRFNFNDTTWTVGLYNNGSSSATCSTTVTVLYERG